MARFSKILAPVEFSPRCLGSAQYAEALACHFHSTITFLHVVKPPYAAYSVPDVAAYAGVVDLESELLKCAREQLDAFPDPPAGAQPGRVILEGDPAGAIVDYARDGHFDLIVMPTHGYGGWERLLHGSVTARVLHHADCPVWTGPHLDSTPAGDSLCFHTVLCAVGREDESGAALDWGASLAREYGAQFHIVHIVHAPDSIREAAERLGAELLVIGRGAHTGRLWRRSADPYAILREAPCPVACV